MKREKGFSLIEAMVATAILVVVVAATLTTLQDALHTSEAITSMADMQDNLRAGMNLMARDLVQAGSGIPIAGVLIPYTGAGVAGPVPLPINRPSPPTLAYTFPVQATMTAITPGYQMGLASLGIKTDMITILYADNTLPWNTMAPINNTANPACNGVIAVNGSTITFNTTTAGCATLVSGNVSVTPGDLLMLTSTSQSTNIIQEVTAVAGNTLTFAAGDAFGFNGVTAGSGTIVQLQNPKGTFPPIKATRVWMITYYLDTITDPQRPQLMRQVNFRPAQAVGQVIEDLNISYDITNPVGTPLPATNVGQPTAPDTPSQIRKVNLYMGARSEAPYSVTQQFFRTNLWTQVSMRALAFQNLYN